MALVTFNPRGVVQNQNKQIQSQGGVSVPNEEGKGPPCSTQCTSSQNGLLPLPVPWGHTGLHCLPLLKKIEIY